jgi:hypothetical protein
MVWGRVTLCRATHITWASALGCLTIRSRPNSKANSLTMLKHLFPLFRVQRCSNIGTVSTWMGDRLEWYPYSRKNADCSCWPSVVSHCEEMIYTCTYSVMRILQLIVSGTLANAGRPERVKNKKQKQTTNFELFQMNPISGCPLRLWRNWIGVWTNWRPSKLTDPYQTWQPVK